MLGRGVPVKVLGQCKGGLLFWPAFPSGGACVGARVFNNEPPGERWLAACALLVGGAGALGRKLEGERLPSPQPLSRRRERGF